MRAVFAETLGARISGSGRSLSETLLRDFERAVLLVRAVRLLLVDAAPAREEALTDKSDFDESVLVVRRCALPLLDEDADVPRLVCDRCVRPLLVGELFVVDALALVAGEVVDFDLRLRRRCVLLIASTSSSFFIPCQPEMPKFLANVASSRRVCALRSAVLIKALSPDVLVVDATGHR